MRKLVNSCFVCKRLQYWSYNCPEKSNLASYRINTTVPFQVCRAKYLGPFCVKDIYYKSSNDDMHKAYIVILHAQRLDQLFNYDSIILDLVEDNRSKNFTNSIKKFIARRGCPKKIISDNGKVFKSQDSHLFCSEQGITWKFNLDSAPCWGGFWERLVGMVKKCLKKSIGSERLSFMELSTVLFEIDNVLNNRPLYFMCDDDVSEVLTRNWSLKINALMRDILKLLKEMICDWGNVRCKRLLKVFGWFGI